MHLICNKCSQDVQVVMPSGDLVSIEHIDRNGWTSHRLVFTTNVEVRSEPKPKTAVEEIWYEIGKRTDKTVMHDLDKQINDLAMALAEAVEWIDPHKLAVGQDVTESSSRNLRNNPDENDTLLRSVLAILRGKKTREIPKP